MHSRAWGGSSNHKHAFGHADIGECCDGEWSLGKILGKINGTVIEGIVIHGLFINCIVFRGIVFRGIHIREPVC